MVLSGRSLPQTSRHGRLTSSRHLQSAPSISEEVVEGDHHIMAEGTGLEPYCSCQSLVRGQGGLEDVQACVDLPVHFPVAHLADEHLAHPISAPSATHWAGLTGPRGIDLDHGHAREGGLVFDLAMHLASRPRVQPAVHPSGATTCTVQSEVLEDDGGPPCVRRYDQSLAYEMKALLDSVTLPPSFALEEPSLEPSIIDFLPCLAASPPEVRGLNLSHAPERDGQSVNRLPLREDAVQRIFVRISGK